MKNISIYLAYHKTGYVPEQSGFIPIQVGTALGKRRFEGMKHDNDGENISSKNRSYCELTAQYWAWKNDKADYYGFFHYRRYLSFDEKVIFDCTDFPKKLPCPYKIYKLPDKPTLKKLGFDPKNMNKVISRYDIIAPLAEKMYVSVYNHYKHCEFHNIEDLDLVLRIIEEKYAEFQNAAAKYMRSKKLYFGNIFVMKQELFYDYCAWMFDILMEFDRRTDFKKYSGKACRVDGYLGERLFGIYYTWLKEQPDVKCAELPRVHFEAFPGETDNFTQMKRVNAFLPPGTRRRAWVKKLSRVMKGI